MRSAIIVLALLVVPSLGAQSQHEMPRVTWTTPDPDYPLKVRVLSSARQEHRHAGIIYTDSYGSANILGTPNVGLDYTSSCEGGFLHNQESGEFYQGKWKKQDREIEILVVETGKSHPEKCKIDVTLKPAPYSKDNPPPKLVTARH
jgi:hypothetical protein